MSSAPTWYDRGGGFLEARQTKKAQEASKCRRHRAEDGLDDAKASLSPTFDRLVPLWEKHDNAALDELIVELDELAADVGSDAHQLGEQCLKIVMLSQAALIVAAHMRHETTEQVHELYKAQFGRATIDPFTRQPLPQPVGSDTPNLLFALYPVSLARDIDCLVEEGVVFDEFEGNSRAVSGLLSLWKAHAKVVQEILGS